MKCKVIFVCFFIELKELKMQIINRNIYERVLPVVLCMMAVSTSFAMKSVISHIVETKGINEKFKWLHADISNVMAAGSGLESNIRSKINNGKTITIYNQDFIKLCNGTEYTLTQTDNAYKNYLTAVNSTDKEQTYSIYRNWWYKNYVCLARLKDAIITTRVKEGQCKFDKNAEDLVRNVLHLYKNFLNEKNATSGNIIEDYICLKETTLVLVNNILNYLNNGVFQY